MILHDLLALKEAELAARKKVTLRCCMAAGCMAESVGALCLPGVSTLICQQLSPEHADVISHADAVVFVDAAVDVPKEVQLRELEPGASSQLMAHAADPRTMLARARDVFGHVPRAWWLPIPAVKLDCCEELSPETQHGREQAVDMIRQLANG